VAKKRMKFKNVKPFRPKKKRAPRKPKENEAKKRQFPRISLNIPERAALLHLFKILRQMAIIFVFAALFVFVLFTAVNIYRNYVTNNNLQSQRQKLIHERNVWESFAEKYKNYKEVYFQIAVREYQLGNFTSAKEYLRKSLFIDPNYEEALKLQKELNSK
jgi:tetratricopeptide (TPR) repeat protein